MPAEDTPNRRRRWSLRQQVATDHARDLRRHLAGSDGPGKVRGAKLFVPATSSICGFDVALVLLDKDITSAPTRKVRLTPLVRGETTSSRRADVSEGAFLLVVGLSGLVARARRRA